MKIRKKIILGIISIMLLAVTFTSTTYAWFKLNSHAGVDFEFKVNGGLGFLVSVDGENYSNDLTTDQIKIAMIQGYNPDRYIVQNNSLKEISGDNYFDVSDDKVNELFTKSLLLSPITSHDGLNFTNLAGSKVQQSSGKYIQFSVYFKATSELVEDNFSYNIYLCGEDIESINGTIATKTTIKSNDVNIITLLDDMVLYNGTEEGLVVGPEKTQKSINVYTSNALRLSIEDTSLEEPKATIFELTDENDLGSYATNYNKETDASDLTDEQKEENNRLYNSNYNAMFTYYNNLRPYSQLTAMNYEDMPKTVRTLSEDVILTNVKSGGPAKLLTFRFWLEGWDSDCFDGLSESINVKLLFNSVIA